MVGTFWTTIIGNACWAALFTTKDICWCLWALVSTDSGLYGAVYKLIIWRGMWSRLSSLVKFHQRCKRNRGATLTNVREKRCCYVFVTCGWRHRERFDSGCEVLAGKGQIGLRCLEVPVPTRWPGTGSVDRGRQEAVKKTWHHYAGETERSHRDIFSRSCSTVSWRVTSLITESCQRWK